jgi:membrane protein
MILFDVLDRWLHARVWGVDLSAVPRWRAALLWVARTVQMLVRDTVEGQLSLRAMSLVFTTLLSLVPFIAVSFSVLKAFGVHNQVEPVLLNLLQPLGQEGVELTHQIIGFVDNIKVGVLGSLGIGLLLYTTVSLIQKVEAAFNYTWHVGRARSLATRFSSYLSVIMVGPVLVFSALGVMASLMSSSVVQGLVAIEPFGSLVRLASLGLPYVLIIAALTFTYVFIPNTRVEFRAALTGGVIAGVAWSLTGKAFATFVMNSTKYTAIYSGFAIVLLSMIWIYLSWLIVLLGASIAFYRQHPEYLVPGGRSGVLSNRMKECLSLMLMALIARHYYRGQPPWTLDALAQRINISAQAVSDLLAVFEEDALLVRTDEEPPAYLPSRPLETTTVKEVLDVVRSANEGITLNLEPSAAGVQVDRLIIELERAVEQTLGGRTVKDLALAEAPPTVSFTGSLQQGASNRGGEP